MSNITSPTLQSGRRPEDPKFPVWAPDGHMEMHTRQNINDLVRHSGWFQKDPVGLIAQAKALQERAAGIMAAAQNAQPAPAPVASAAPAVEDGAMPRLTALRKELSDAGGIPDPTWGVAKLEQAIAAKKAGVPLPKDEDDE